jgi:hypothetical protein
MPQPEKEKEQDIKKNRTQLKRSHKFEEAIQPSKRRRCNKATFGTSFPSLPQEVRPNILVKIIDDYEIRSCIDPNMDDIDKSADPMVVLSFIIDREEDWELFEVEPFKSMKYLRHLHPTVTEDM